MKTLFEHNPLRSCGLVVIFPDQGANMWDPELNGLVDSVEGSVKGAFVTFALINGRHPSLVDALSAARFNGCSSAVVVVADSRGPDRPTALMPVDSEFPITMAGSARDPEAVADAYFAALLDRPAACA